MGFLRYKRWARRKWGAGWPESVVLAAYRHSQRARRTATADREAHETMGVGRAGLALTVAEGSVPERDIASPQLAMI